MVTDSNQRLIVAYWRQYFFIKYRNLPPDTIRVPTPGESHCTVWNSQKSSGGPPAAAACWADRSGRRSPAAFSSGYPITRHNTVIYSLRSASIGFRFDALTDGSSPNTIPISMENATLPIIAGTLMAARVSDIRAMIWDRIIPTRTPIIPPQLVSTADSVRN